MRSRFCRKGAAIDFSRNGVIGEMGKFQWEVFLILAFVRLDRRIGGDFSYVLNWMDLEVGRTFLMDIFSWIIRQCRVYGVWNNIEKY